MTKDSVETIYGRISGSVADGVHVFRGIPYARPPVGEFRFAAPQLPAPISGILECTENGGSSLQVPLPLPIPGMEVGRQDEDCLYLNVSTPGLDDRRRPVLVWIHGGSFIVGAGSQAMYDGSRLSRRGDVVVVTFNYRLGVLGFLHLAGVGADLDGAVSNCGIRDQVAALEWVRENISAFGGDPDNVTLFGESAGAMSISTLLATPMAGELFHRAILQSGAAHNFHEANSATQVAQHFLKVLGVRPKDAVQRLREISAAKILEAQDQAALAMGTRFGLLPFQPTIGDELVPRSPLEVIRSGESNQIDLIVGTNRDEFNLFGAFLPFLQSLDEDGLHNQFSGFEDPATLIDAYREGSRETENWADLYLAMETDRVFRIPAHRIAEAQFSAGANVFFYRFDWESRFATGRFGACHTIDLPFVFGTTDGDEQSSEFFNLGPRAVRLSETMMDSWLAFARNGDPSHADLPDGRWPPWYPHSRKTLIFKNDLATVEDPESDQRQAWDNLI